MNYLSRIVLSSLLLSALSLNSCKESTVVPYETIPEPIQRYFAQKWLMSQDSSSSNTEVLKGWLLDIKRDGYYNSSSPKATSTQGRWYYKASDSSVTLVPEDGSQKSTFRIDSISNSTIVLKNTATKTSLNFQSQSGPLFSISGSITFDKNIRIPNNPNLAVFWKAAGGNDVSFVWGTGTIDVLTNTYRIDFDSYPPDSLISKFYGCNGKVGVGTVYLFSDPVAAVQGREFRGLVPLNTVGTVRNKAIVFLFGRFQDSNCELNVPWVNSFSNGFNLGKALYSSPASGYFEPSSDLSSDLIITDDPQKFISPIWWR